MKSAFRFLVMDDIHSLWHSAISCCLHLMLLRNTLFLNKKKYFSKGILNFSLQSQSLKTSLPLSSLQWFHPNPSYSLHSYPLLRGNDKIFSDTELGSSAGR